MPIPRTLQRATLLPALATALFAPLAHAEITVSSDPVGYYRIPLAEGFQTIGVSLVNSPALVSLVDSANGDTITLTENGVTIGGLFETNAKYYVEIVEGPTGVDDPLVGHRFEVDLDETADPDTEDGDIIIDPAADTTTLDLEPLSGPAPDLTDHRVELRKHMRMGEAFDKSLLFASTSLSSADQIQYYDGTKFIAYYLLRNEADTARAWVKSDLITIADNEIIPPGVGLVYKRSSSATSSADLVISGKVRTNPFQQPLQAGFNFVAEPFPVSTNFVEREALAPTFVADPSASQADQVQVFDGTKFVAYHLFASADGSQTAWVLSSNPVTNENTTTLFNYRHPVFFKMQVGAEDYRVPLSWTP